MLICCCLYFTCSFCQNIRFTSEIGYSISKVSNEKKIGLYRGFGLGIDKYISNNWYVELLPNINTIQFSSHNRLDESIYTTIIFFELNTEAKKYMPISAKSKIYLAIGPYCGYVLNKKIENDGSSRIENNKNLGFNLGLSSCVGLRTSITQSLSFDIGLSDKKDYLFIYNNASEKIKNTKRNLKISFYLKLKNETSNIVNPHFFQPSF